VTAARFGVSGTISRVTDSSRAARREHWRLLALPPLDESLLRALFDDLPVEVIVPSERTQVAAADAMTAADLVLGDWTGGLKVEAAGLPDPAPIAFVQQPSVGVDSVDVDGLAARGIPVANAAGANAVSVAEWCIGASYAVLRWLSWADQQTRAGGWPQLEVAQRGGGEVTGRRVGIIGMGPIGRECAQRFVALGADVAYWSRSRHDDAGGARWLELDELLAHSQLLVVVVALAPATRGLLSAERLKQLPDGAFVVNAARGGVLDETALLDVIRSGHVAGAALDVYAIEPLPADSPLRGEERILLSPHAAGATREAQGRLIGAVVDNIRRAVSGEPVLNVVNGIDPMIRRR
jgi:phosphoglycerate dehydrogenase-like enzyme